MRKKERAKILLLNKIVQKNFLKAIFLTVVAGYIWFSILSIAACSPNREESFFDQQQNTRGKIAQALLQKFDAQMFNCNNEIVGIPLIMDTVVISIKESNGEYFIRTKVNANCNKKYFANLRCCKEIVDQFKQAKSNYAFVVAKITNTIDYNLTAEADSLEGAKALFNLGSAVLLNGECLALAEVPPIINAN